MKLITVPFQVIGICLRYPGSFPEKVSVFRTLFSLKFKKLFFRSVPDAECRQRIFNYTVSGYDYETLHTLFYDLFLSPPYFFKSKNPDPLIVDCGAHIGMSVLYFKKLYPTCNIHAIEANPHAFHLLQKNISANNLSGVTLHLTALGKIKGPVSFYVNDNPASINGSVLKGLDRQTEVKTESIPLSELISGIPGKIDLVKIDIEGSEPEVVEELTEAGVLNRPDQYIIEYHHKHGPDRSRLTEFLKPFEKNGFQYTLCRRSQIGDFEDILIHLHK